MEENYEVISIMYNKAMKDIFKQIPTTMSKPLSPKKTSINLWQKWVVDSIWKKIGNGLPPLMISTISKKSQDKEDEIENYMKLISGGIIGNFNYIGTILNGLIQEVKSKGKKPIHFLQ